MRAMQDLRQDLLDTKITFKEALLEMDDENIRKIVNEYVEATLNCIIKRIDTDLLKKEIKQLDDAYDKGFSDCYVRKSKRKTK